MAFFFDFGYILYSQKLGFRPFFPIIYRFLYSFFGYILNRDLRDGLSFEFVGNMLLDRDT